MKVLVQRVSGASVTVDKKITGEIGNGLLLLIGIAENDSENDLDRVAEKCVNLRIFEDEDSKMNWSLLDVGGEILAISQFTLLADTSRGRRPSYIQAANPEKGKAFYDLFVTKLRAYSVKVETGIFGAMMDVKLVNRGPVTIMIENK
jgi:D-tyrosyl-tRNA(Tyr) deacylase